MTFETWTAFALASLIVLAIPGPTVLLVLSYALSQGRRVAVASAAGVALGDFVAMSAALFGLGALVMASATLFSLLKYAGAAYLVWMGVKLIRSARAGQFALPDAPGLIRPGAVFREAALVTVLNPKPIAFFIAFVPQFIAPAQPLAPQFALLIATFVTLGTLNALAYALMADRLRVWLLRPGAQGWMARAGGVTLIGMGLLTATLRHKPA